MKTGYEWKPSPEGTLMQIWKSPYMSAFIWKQYPGNFAFLIKKFSIDLPVKSVNLLKK